MGYVSSSSAADAACEEACCTSQQRPLPMHRCLHARRRELRAARRHAAGIGPQPHCLPHGFGQRTGHCPWGIPSLVNLQPASWPAAARVARSHRRDAIHGHLIIRLLVRFLGFLVHFGTARVVAFPRALSHGHGLARAAPRTAHFNNHDVTRRKNAHAH